MLGEQIFIPRPGQPAPHHKEFVDPLPPLPLRGFGKPGGGLWTSTYETSAEDGCESWCATEMPHWLSDTGYVLTPNADANVLTISGGADVADFVAAYGRMDDYLLRVDWASIVADYDGLRITNPYSPHVRFGEVSAFYGWDCESTWWTRWVFEQEEGRAVRCMLWEGGSDGNQA